MELVYQDGGCLEAGNVPLVYRQVGSGRVDPEASKCAKQLVQAVGLRRKYMELSLQNVPGHLDGLKGQESGIKDNLKGKPIPRGSSNVDSLKVLVFQQGFRLWTPLHWCSR